MSLSKLPSFSHCFKAHPNPVWQHLNLITSAGILFPNKVTFTGSRWTWIWTLFNSVHFSSLHLCSCILLNLLPNLKAFVLLLMVIIFHRFISVSPKPVIHFKCPVTDPPVPRTGFNQQPVFLFHPISSLQTFSTSAFRFPASLMLIYWEVFNTSLAPLCISVWIP